MLKPLRRAPYLPRRPLPPGTPASTLRPEDLTDDELEVLRGLAAHPCAWVPVELTATLSRLEQAGAVELRSDEVGRRVAWRPALGPPRWTANVTACGRSILVECRQRQHA